jgi:hypothetical protein
MNRFHDLATAPSTTSIAVHPAGHRVMIVAHGPNCEVARDPDGEPMYVGEFRRMDWAITLLLADVVQRIAVALAGDEAIIGGAVTWLQVRGGHMTHGVSICVSDRLDPQRLRQGLLLFFRCALHDCPLGAVANVDETAHEAIEQIAQRFAAAARAAAIDPPLSIHVAGETPIEVRGRWAAPAHTRTPDTIHSVVLNFDGIRLTKRRLYVFGEDGCVDIAYDEARWLARLREVLRLCAAGRDPRLSIVFRTTTINTRRANVLTHLELADADDDSAAELDPDCSPIAWPRNIAKDHPQNEQLVAAAQR